MKPFISQEGHIVANCPSCGARSTYERRNSQHEFGSVVQEGSHSYDGLYWDRIVYMLLRCAGCGRGGLVAIHCDGQVFNGRVGDFFPVSIVNVSIPGNTPDGIKAEYREAEKCISFGAWRAASALLRSTLEKTLITNGYTDQALQAAGKGKNLKQRIELAGEDGVITSARRQRAQDDVRVLGNDVLHDEWREVIEEEVILSHHYVQRILEDFYDDRQTVESLLIGKGRITITPAATATTP